MCNPVYDIVNINVPLVLIEKSSPCSDFLSGYLHGHLPCQTPVTVNKMC